MNSALAALGPDEYILRRIHQSHCDLNLPVPVLLAAFRPNKMDTDGLSVFRESVISAAEVAAAGRGLRQPCVETPCELT